MPAHVPHRPGPWIPRSFQTADNPVVVTVYEDVVTGTITLSGAITESWRASDSPSGTVTLSGSATSTHVFTDSVSGVITLSGSLTELQSQSVSPGGTVVLSGSNSESFAITGGSSTTPPHRVTPPLSPPLPASVTRSSATRSSPRVPSA
jgi:hypothetical protein